METRLTNYINGVFQPPINDKYIPNVNPVDGTTISLIPESNGDDVSQAVTAATTALTHPDWNHSCVSLRQRAEWLIKIADGIEARVDQFAQAESLDTGKPITRAKNVDIMRAVANFRYFAQIGANFHSDCNPSEAGGFNYTDRRPVGVVGLITPWNLPLYLLTWKVAPALMMGNTIVAKPSEMTPTTASLLAQLCHDIGLPRGVFNVVHGTGMSAGQPLVEHRKVAAISFTGGTYTGAIVASSAGRTFKKLSLELGGKNPNVIFADCDLDRAVETAVQSSFANSGQICLCGSRIIVEASIYDLFLEKFLSKIKSTIVLGLPSDPKTTMGTVISFQHLEKIEGMVATAIAEGGTVVTGGKRPSDEYASRGAFYEPTVITGLAQDAKTVQEEIFGPVVTVQKFEGDAEALAMANGVRYGLASSVWTSNLDRAHRFSQEIESGIVWVNSWMVRDLNTPFGGVKDSGIGREGGTHSLEYFSEAKNIYIHLPRRLPGSSVASAPAASPKVLPPLPTPAPVVATPPTAPTPAATSGKEVIDVSAAPKPVGAYPHARVYGDLLFLSGIGPRTPGTNEVPGGPIRDENKKPLNYDVKAQTRQVIENIKIILNGCNATLDDIIDVQVFLIDMDRDFKDFNSVYGEYFKSIQATRTTVAINALPTPIAVEFKVICRNPASKKV